MEISEDIRPILCCNECNELLSCGPVYFLHEINAAICGRCSFQTKQEENGEVQEENKTFMPKLSRSRYVQYEALAQHFIFPCFFANNGCQEKMAFSSEQPNSHERHCPFRTFVCPIVGPNSCEWIGSTDHLMKHCCEAHPKHVLENPCQIPRPDLTRSHLANYLISAFNFLFLVQLKVSLTSGQLCHSVRMFGETDFLDKFSYCLQIEGNNKTLIERGSVLERELMVLQEPTAICTSINGLLGFMGGQYELTNFTLTINSLVKFSCSNCKKDMASNTQYCESCQRTMIQCDNNFKGCLFVDVNKDKCRKHKRNFCKYQTECLFSGCGVKFNAGGLVEHLGSPISCQNTIKANLNSSFRITRNLSDKTNFIILSSNVYGTILCQYYLNELYLQLSIFLSLPFCDLKKLTCSIELTDPQTNYTRIETPEVQENNYHDWLIKQFVSNFPSWENLGIKLKIYITKKE